MGRLSKIKRELIEEANRRLLGEQQGPPAGFMGDLCPGTFTPSGGPYPNNFTSHYPTAIDGVNLSQADVGKTILQLPDPVFGTVGGTHVTITQVIPLPPPRPQFAHLSVTSNWTEQACPTPDVETITCEEFKTWPKAEQRDFCEGCSRDDAEPGCECCTDVWR